MAAAPSSFRTLILFIATATVAFVYILLYHIPPTIFSHAHENHDDVAVKKDKYASTSRVPYITFMFNQTAEEVLVDHNCETLTRSGYVFHIFTNNVHQRACSTCTCHLHILTPCECPHPESNGCGYCHKMHFMVNAMQRFSAFIFMDTDFVILKDIFIPELQSRTQYSDFLAIYVFSPVASWRYTTAFNSGLMFMRRLENVDYGSMLDNYQQRNSNGDQNSFPPSCASITPAGNHYRSVGTVASSTVRKIT